MTAPRADVHNVSSGQALDHADALAAQVQHFYPVVRGQHLDDGVISAVGGRDLRHRGRLRAGSRVGTLVDRDSRHVRTQRHCVAHVHGAGRGPTARAQHQRQRRPPPASSLHFERLMKWRTHSRLLLIDSAAAMHDVRTEELTSGPLRIYYIKFDYSISQSM